MLTVEELEACCAAEASPCVEEQPTILPAALTIEHRYYPWGFPLDLYTNSEEVLEHCEVMWGKFENRFHTSPIRMDVHVVERADIECPPGPEYRFLDPMLVAVADGNHYSIVDIARKHSRMVLTSATLRHHPLYARYFFLEGGGGVHVATRHATPVHAGCVMLEGRGVLLCGDSGAGKSSLSFACARSGWTYVTDDGAFLLHGGSGRMVIGNCRQVRLRPTAAEFFPEIAGLPLTPRAEGKPSIEISTEALRIACEETAEIDFIVFLNRRNSKETGIFPYTTEVARRYMRQTLFGTSETVPRQHRDIERLLEARILELRYQTFDEAEQLLRRLVFEEQ